jgi:RimJ/RimL family protein N-acetyltransferase
LWIPSLVETVRLRLRPPVEDDLEAWAAIRTDREVSRYLGPPIEDRADVGSALYRAQERHAADGFGLLMMVRKSDERLIGRSGFLVWDTRVWTQSTLRDVGPDHAEVEVGWTLARDCWGHGYVTEAARACHAYGFDTLRLARIAAIIQDGNQRSVAVAQRLGMHYERGATTVNGFDVQVWRRYAPRGCR